MASWSTANDDLKCRDNLGFWSAANNDLMRRDGKLKRRNCGLKRRDGDLGFLHFKNRLREYVRERENKVGKVKKKNGAECF